MRDDDGFPDDHEELVEDMLHTEVLMGWDGDPCECRECDCPRFRDAAPDGRCASCRAGDHGT